MCNVADSPEEKPDKQEHCNNKWKEKDYVQKTDDLSRQRERENGF